MTTTLSTMHGWSGWLRCVDEEMVNGADLCLKRSVPNGEVLCKRPVLRGGDACSGFPLFPLSFAPYLCVALPPETLPAFKTSATAFERILHGVIAAGFFFFFSFPWPSRERFPDFSPPKMIAGGAFLPETLPAFKTSATTFEIILHSVFGDFYLAATSAFSRLQPTRDDLWWSVPAKDPPSVQDQCYSLWENSS